ncbi:AAA family ATPase [Pseudomonas citrulli]|uniref:AAA family ATPase n=1 Tax=Pseudomonas citrulli TaxID=3064347 RepID=A0ABT9BY84_9PSED|nr:AAA family ATPase [Pseudomonas sp. K18]MDO7896889.1 AAA family ATPase [Pseudomonas sp. K18]
MRFVWRDPGSTPSSLAAEALLGEMSLLREHFEMPAASRLTRRPKLNRRKWSSREVKSALLAAFQEKCGYCEKDIGPFEFEVHHHRPILNAKDRMGYSGTPSPDHYAWYAYEWANLVLACPVCARYKSSQFPTQYERVAPFTPLALADQERPVLIDPSSDDPFEHLAFNVEGFCVGRNDRGKETVDVLKLNRSELVGRRAAIFSEWMIFLEKLRGRDYKEILADVESQLNDRRAHVGAARIWMVDALRTTSESDTRLHEAEFCAELARFIDVCSPPNWRQFTDQLKRGHGRRSILRSDLVEAVGEVQTTKFARIRSIQVKNFKGFSRFTLDLSSRSVAERGIAPATVLLGENAVGKSSLLQAIALGTMGRDLRSQVKANFDAFLRKPQERTDQMWQSASDSRGAAQASIRIEFDDGSCNQVHILRGGEIRDESFESALVLGYGAHRLFSEQPKNHKNIKRVSSIVSLFNNQRTLPHSADWLESLDEKIFPTVARALREILNLADEDEIIRTDHSGLLISKNGEAIPLPRLSDGYRSLFAMALDIIRNMVKRWGDLESSRGIVLIDEIEIHLHPRWKMQVVGALRRAMPQVQFIFTTHDPLCLRGMLEGEVHVLIRDEQRSIVEMGGLPDVSAMRAEQLLTSEYFGLASTAEPETLRRIDQLLLSEPRSVEAQAQFSERLGAFSMIGDTPERQVVNEALRRHIVEQFRSNRLDRAEVREESINLILESLRDAGGIGQ